jgi:pentatricopeptide repeat protein
MMKGYLSQGQEAAAARLLQEMVQKGIANATSFHGPLNARANAGDLRGAWKLVSEMQSNGMSPNAVTCAILLKGTQQSVQEVSRVLVLIDATAEAMDEVLFMAVAEACVRINRLDMLNKQLERFQRQASAGLSAETYGSLIKAYGRARDTKRVWDLWGQMVAGRSQLTSVTLGCMVEALVANGQSKEAWKLVKDMLNGQGTQPLVNTVICSSILKGFAYSKDAEKVMTIYKEMQAHKIQPNTITFNTILNAFAQCGTMQHAPELLEDMKLVTPPIEPDIVTYSTLVKGYCQAGSLDRALHIFTDMQRDGKCAPDEVIFNSLLGGCAKEFRLEDALKLLSDMRKAGIAPSNYTLSMLVKLMCRCRRLDQAFTMLEDISKEYNFRINIQVYTCLLQGCFFHGQVDKGLSVYDKIVNEGLQPDSMLYTVLARGCLRAGDVDKAADMVRRAHGIHAKAALGNKKSVGINPVCLEEVVAALGGASSKNGAALLADLEGSQTQAWRR